jgi:hypothetical protein
MSLADDILPRVDQASAALLRAAPKFVISREVLMSATAVLKLPMAAQLQALKLCRLPFTSCWFEWTAAYGGRIGVLLRADENEHELYAGRCWSFVWNDVKDAGDYGPVGIFDWREVRQLPDHPLSDADWEDCRTEGRNPLRMGAAAGEGRREWEEYRARHRVAIVPGMPEPDLEETGFVISWMSYARAFLLLMNSKNIIGTTSITHTEKLQRARIKSRKAPLLDYTRVDIKLSKAMAARAGAAADPAHPKRLHICRGHLKIRRTGIFWWNAHPRGSADAGIIREQVRHVRNPTSPPPDEAHA